MKKIVYVLIGVALFFIVRYIVTHDVGKDELWVERVPVSEGGTIDIYHSDKCPRSKPFSIDKVDKIEYRKTKFSVFDICIDEKEAEMLNSISKYNINRILERGWTYSEEIELFVYYEENICDLTDSDDYRVYYSLYKGKTKKLNKSLSGCFLLDDMGGKVEW